MIDVDAVNVLGIRVCGDYEKFFHLGNCNMQTYGNTCCIEKLINKLKSNDRYNWGYEIKMPKRDIG